VLGPTAAKFEKTTVDGAARTRSVAKRPPLINPKNDYYGAEDAGQKQSNSIMVPIP